MRISRNGGTPETIIESEIQRFFLPQILPDGKALLFTAVEEGRLQVAVQSLESGERNYLFPGNSARYLPTGHIVYALENDLFAVPFDPNSLEVSGGGIPVIEGVFRATSFFPAHFAVSDSGTLVYLPGSLSSSFMQQRTAVWVDREGKAEAISAKPDDYGCPRISLDGTWLAMVIDSGEGEDIWIWDLLSETWTKLTTDDFNNEAPLWTRDGGHVVFVTVNGHNSVLKKIAADGTGEIEQIAEIPRNRKSSNTATNTSCIKCHLNSETLRPIIVLDQKANWI